MICLASWQVGEWVSRLVPLVARDGHITQISRPALVKAEYIIILMQLGTMLGQITLGKLRQGHVGGR